VRRIRAVEAIGVVLVLAVAAGLRFWRLRAAPGWEWDEPNYTNIATNLGLHGRLEIKHDILAAPSDYLFHPPFYFLLLAGWFKLVGFGIFEARILIALSSLVLLGLCYLLFRRRLGVLALVPVFAIACDGWLVFSNRVAWFDHLMLVLGVAGLLLYERARNVRTGPAYALAGATLGLAAVFKHLGIYFLLAVAIHWLLTDGGRRAHAVLFASAGGVVALYLATMTTVFGGAYWRASHVQFGRASGTWESGGGSVGGAGDIGPVLQQYRLFYTTIAIAIAGLVMLMIRVVRMIRARSTAAVAETGVTFSWLVAGLIFFAVLQIRFPQYFMMVLIPLYGFVAIETLRWLPRRRRALTSAAVVVLAAMLAADGITFWQRIASRSDNALAAVAAFANANIPASDVVVTEQPIGVLIRQPYCETWKVDKCEGRAQWLIDYRTKLFEPQHVDIVDRLAHAGRKVATFRGFKETISVYDLRR
jgi:4-amino-4-deoxy-L-arabinose transferase-like glycosyltransferase